MCLIYLDLAPPLGMPLLLPLLLLLLLLLPGPKIWYLQHKAPARRTQTQATDMGIVCYALCPSYTLLVLTPFCGRTKRCGKR
jgi:hypothetical protein